MAYLGRRGRRRGKEGEEAKRKEARGEGRLKWQDGGQKDGKGQRRTAKGDTREKRASRWGF